MAAEGNPAHRAAGALGKIFTLDYSPFFNRLLEFEWKNTFIFHEGGGVGGVGGRRGVSFHHLIAKAVSHPSLFCRDLAGLDDGLYQWKVMVSPPVSKSRQGGQASFEMLILKKQKGIPSAAVDVVSSRRGTPAGGRHRETDEHVPIQRYRCVM